MTATRPPRTAAIEVELDRVLRQREELLRTKPCPARSEQIADQFDLEAWLWSTVFEKTSSRLMWRAALAAEAHARMSARWWRLRAASAVAGGIRNALARNRGALRVPDTALAAYDHSGGSPAPANEELGGECDG
jgi:hypothetical protein